MAGARLIALSELRFSPTAELFEGGDDVGVSIFVTHYERGQGVSLHRHPYPEVFVVHSGEALFEVDGEELAVSAGHMVVAPALAPHRFEGAGDETLHVISVHPSGLVHQTDL